MNLDRAFHRLISDAAHNSIVAMRLRRIDDEHQAILRAIKGRDRAEAEAAMRSHIDSSRKHIMRTI